MTAAQQHTQRRHCRISTAARRSVWYITAYFVALTNSNLKDIHLLFNNYNDT
jgi:hypothetical protein